MSEYDHRPFRIEANELCTIARDDGSVVGGVLVDISDDGFCVECHRNLEVGEKIEIRAIGLGRMPGIVCWSECNRAGGVLDLRARDF